MSDSSDQGDEVAELLSLTYDGESFQISLQPDFFENPRDWGDILAEVVRSIARAGEEDDEAETLGAIQAAFNDALAQPPEDPS